MKFLKDNKNKSKLLIGVCIFTVSFLATIYLINNSQSQSNFKEEAKEIIDNVVVYSTSTPDENIPDEKYQWNGESSQPKKIEIPSVSISGFIQNVGVDQNNQIAVPNNVHLAGWFVQTVLPGNNGLSIINGHVDGLNGPGIFRDLQNVKVGEYFSIENGDGKEFTYVVKEVATVPTAEAASVLYSKRPSIGSQLNLITCVGDFVENESTYDHRFIVIAELISN